MGFSLVKEAALSNTSALIICLISHSRDLETSTQQGIRPSHRSHRKVALRGCSMDDLVSDKSTSII